MKRILTILISLLATCAWSQYSSNNQSIVIDGTASNYTGNYYVGNTNSYDSLLITNAGTLTVASGSAGLSVGSVSSNNTAIVTGTGSIWSCSSNFYVGNYGKANALTIANGAKVFNTVNTYFGNNTGSDSNTILITGSGSSLSNAGSFNISLNGSKNTLTLDNSGALYTRDLTLGDNGNGQDRIILTNGGTLYSYSALSGQQQGATNQTIVISGTGSMWSNNTIFTLGDVSGNNSLTIERGGVLHNTNVFNIGTRIAVANSSNRVYVTGTGSLLNCGSMVVSRSSPNDALIVDKGGEVRVSTLLNFNDNPPGSSRLIITNGGIISGVGSFYVGFHAGGDNGIALIDGAGSVYSNSDTFSFGRLGSSNLLTVSSGGKLYSAATWLGAQFAGSGATANRINITGSNSLWQSSGNVIVCIAGNINNGVTLSTGGTLKVIGNLTINTNGYVTNYVSQLSGGLDLTNTTLTVNGKLSLIFNPPAQSGFYWGLRWAGNHTNELITLRNSGKLLIDDTSMSWYYRNKVGITYDLTNTYIGMTTDYYQPDPVGSLLTIR